MPIYSYECMRCLEKFERQATIAERDLQYCKKCSHILDRTVDAPGGVWSPTSRKGGLAV